MYVVQLFAVLALFVLLNLSGSHPGTFCKAASPDDNGAQQETVSQISDPMYLKFMDVEDGSFVKMEGVVGSIQASHSSYSRNTFFLKSTEVNYKVLVTSPSHVKVSIKEGQCVRVQGTINLSQSVPTLRLPTSAVGHPAAVLCTSETAWWD